MLVKIVLKTRICRSQLEVIRRTTSSARIKWDDWTPSGLVKRTPVQVQPFLKLIRLDKPTGTFLLFWPASWGIALATPLTEFPDLKIVGIFAAGSFLMRGAACVINDLWDRKYDIQVERTKTRPLVSGEMTIPQAIGLLGILLSTSLSCLIQLNYLTILIGISSIIPTIAYPLAKRYTYWPQLALGATINYGAIMGFTAVTNEFIPEAIFPLYFSAICWTMIYDTIYAHQDKDDDSKIGVKSTALKFKEKTKLYLTGFGVGMISNMALAGYMVDLSWPFYMALGTVGCQFAWQIGTLNIDNKEDCWKKFNSNQWIGIVVLAGVLAGTIVNH